MPSAYDALLEPEAVSEYDALLNSEETPIPGPAATPRPNPTPVENAGLLEAGNIDLTNRPRVQNEDGSISTVRSISRNVDGREVLMPTISDDGRVLSPDEALQQYSSTGKHLGIFDNPENATAYAQRLHESQAASLNQPIPTSVQGPGNVPSEPLTRRSLVDAFGSLLRIPGKTVQTAANSIGGLLTGDIFENPVPYLETPTDEDIRQPLLPASAMKVAMPALYAGDVAKAAFPKSSLAARLRGFTESVAEGASSLTNMENAATLPLGGGGKAAQVAIAASFEALALANLPDQWAAFKAEKDPEKQAKIFGEMALGLGVPAAGGVLAALQKTPKAPRMSETLDPIIGDKRRMVPIDELPPTEPVAPVTEVAPEAPVVAPETPVAPVEPKVGSRIEGPALVDTEGNVLVQGKIGETHADLMKRALEEAADDATGDKVLEAFQNDAQHVFMDDAGNILNREQAAPIGVKAGQLPEGTTKVESQMLKVEKLPLTVENSALDPRGREIDGVTISSGARGSEKSILEAERLKDGTLQVYNVIVDPSYRGGGNGLALYERLIQEAKGAPVVSDLSVTESAAGVWESLGKRGVPVRKNPTAYLVDFGVSKRWVTEDKKPVFEITPEVVSPETAPKKKANQFKIPHQPLGAEDIIDIMVENGGVKSRTKENADLWNDQPNLKGVYRQILGGKLAPDQMAAIAAEHGFGDGSLTSFWQEVDKAVQSRRSLRAQTLQQAKTEKAANARDKAFSKEVLTPDETRQQVNSSNMHVGDEMTVAGEKFKVTEIDPDTLDVTLEDGKKYGVQTVQDGQVVYVDSTELVPRDQDVTFEPEPPDVGVTPEIVAKYKRQVARTGVIETPSGDTFRVLESDAQPGKFDVVAIINGKREVVSDPFNPTDMSAAGDLAVKRASGQFESEVPTLKPGEEQGGLPVGDTKTVEQLATEKAASDAALLKAQQAQDARVGADKALRAGDDIRSEKDFFEEEVQGDIFDKQGAIAPGSSTLSALPPAAVTRPIKSQRQIITDLAKGLKVPIRFGRLVTNKFAGYFMPKADLIGSKRANDLTTVTHEVGHKLDKEFSFSADKAIRSELNVLGDPATPGSFSSWTKSKTLKYKYGEGIAEFVRYWLTDPAKAAKEAPATHAAFLKILDANKDVGDVLRQAQDDIQVWRTSEAQARVRSHISVGDNPNKTRYTLSQLTRDAVDDLHILRLATEEAKRMGGGLDPSKDPYMMARNLRGSYGMADTFVRSGVSDFRTRAVQLGTSLEDALKPVAGRLNDFRDWIVSKQAKEMMRHGKETGLLADDVDTVVKRFDGDKDFHEAFRAVKMWNANVLKYAVDSGLVTPESATSMLQMNRDFVPFHRVFEVGAGESSSLQSMGTGSGLNAGKPGSMKGRHGSTRQIVDPIETMVKNAYAIITASEKSAINNAVADLSRVPGMGKWVERVAAPKEQVKVTLEKVKEQLEDAGADVSQVPDDLALSFFRQAGKPAFGENTIRIVKNGQPEFYRLNKDLFDTFQALDLEDSGMLIRMLASPAQVLRAGVVLEPSFALANALRDTFSAAVMSKYGALPFESTIRGLGAMINNPKLVAEWAASGGKSAVEANYFDRTKLQKFLTEKITKELTPAEKALVVVKSPLTALRWLTGLSEEATRVGEYQIALKKLQKGGMPEGEARRLAAFEARDRQDFAKGGAKTKIVRHVAAFWNAALQGNVKLAQTFKERPIRTLAQGIAFVTIPKLLEQAVNWDDQDYWDRPQWERDLFFLIPAGKDDNGHTRFIRIPTPFEVGVLFGTLPGRVIQYAKQHDPKALTSYFETLLKTTVPNPMPQSAQMIFEDFLSGKQGWDVYRGRPIVPDSLADQPPEMQWTEQTSEFAKKVGGLVNMSPMKIDHMIGQTTGGLGKVLTGQQAPGKRFVTTPLAVSNQSTQDFYDQLDKMRADKKRHESDETVEYSPEKLKRFEKAAREMSELRKELRNSVTSAERKTQVREEIYQKVQEAMSEE